MITNDDDDDDDNNNDDDDYNNDDDDDSSAHNNVNDDDDDDDSSNLHMTMNTTRTSCGYCRPQMMMMKRRRGCDNLTIRIWRKSGSTPTSNSNDVRHLMTNKTASIIIFSIMSLLVLSSLSLLLLLLLDCFLLVIVISLLNLRLTSLGSVDPYERTMADSGMSGRFLAMKFETKNQFVMEKLLPSSSSSLPLPLLLLLVLLVLVLDIVTIKVSSLSLISEAFLAIAMGITYRRMNTSMTLVYMMSMNRFDTNTNSH